MAPLLLGQDALVDALKAPEGALFGLPPVQAKSFGAEDQVWTAPSSDPTLGIFRLTTAQRFTTCGSAGDRSSLAIAVSWECE